MHQNPREEKERSLHSHDHQHDCCCCPIVIIIKGEAEVSQVKGTFTISVKPVVQALTLTPDGGALPDAVVGQAVQEDVTVVSGGTPPYSFAVTNGALPDGLSLGSTLNSDGTETVDISGTPTTEGDAAFELTVTDADGVPVTASMTASVRRPIASAKTKRRF